MDTIRMATPQDGPGLAAIYDPIVAGTCISFEVDPPGPEEMARRVEAAHDVTPWLVLEDGRGVAGYAYASRHRERAAYRWSVDVSVYVREDRRRGGVGRALYTSLLAVLRLQGFRAAHAGVTLPNPGSVALHEAVGFRPVGVYRKVGFKAGAWHDVGWWQLELLPREGEPPPPRPLAAVLADPGYPAALAAGLRLLRP